MVWLTRNEAARKRYWILLLLLMNLGATLATIHAPRALAGHIQSDASCNKLNDGTKEQITHTTQDETNDRRYGNSAVIKVTKLPYQQPSPAHALIHSIYLVKDFPRQVIEFGWKWDVDGLDGFSPDGRPTVFLKVIVDELIVLRSEGEGSSNPGWAPITQGAAYEFRIRGNVDSNPRKFRLTVGGLLARTYTHQKMGSGLPIAGVEAFAHCVSMSAHFSELKLCSQAPDDGSCTWISWPGVRKSAVFLDRTDFWKSWTDPSTSQFWLHHCQTRADCADRVVLPRDYYGDGEIQDCEAVYCEPPPPPPPPPPPSGSWSGWERHDQTLAVGSGLDAASWQAGNLRVVARSPGNNVWLKKWDSGTAWTAWSSLSAPSGGITSDPAITDSGPNLLHVFARGTDNTMWTRYWNGSTWGAWTSLGGGFISGPDAVTLNGWVAVFARGNDNAVWKKVRRPDGSWEDWASLGGNITSDPSAVLVGCCEIHLYARGSDGQLAHQLYDANTGTWYPWTAARVSGVINSAPDASSWGSAHVDIFANSGNNELYRSTFNDRRLTRAWTSLGGTLTGDPGAVSWGSGRIDVFIRGADNVMYHRWCEPCDA